MALTYEPLNATVRERIWEGFLKKLARERPEIIVTDRAVSFLREDDIMKNAPWNGREIRNGTSLFLV